LNPTYDFHGQVAVVTGASSGMGRDTARAFAAAGAAVVLADTDEDALPAATDEVDAFGRLDMAFNNASIMIPPSDAADEPAENFDRVTRSTSAESGLA
jgi:NAD(P)-dependent dehydrogenase (short-subunit alcohol dehydrogenase family)